MRRLQTGGVALFFVGTSVFSVAMAQSDEVSLRFAPEEGSSFTTRIWAKTVEVTSEIEGAPTPAQVSDERRMYFGNEISNIASDGTVTLIPSTRHLQIFIDRPDWTGADYDSLAPKRNAANVTRILDYFVSKRSAFQELIQPDGTIVDTVGFDEYLIHMSHHLNEEGIGQDFLATIRDDITSPNVAHAIEGPFFFLTANPVKKGDTWVSNLSQSIPYGGMALVTWKNTFEGVEEIDGRTLAVIRSTASATMQAALAKGNRISVELGDVTGTAVTHVDLTLQRPVFSDSTLTLPLNISTQNPVGGQDTFKKTYILTNSYKNVHENEIPVRYSPPRQKPKR